MDALSKVSGIVHDLRLTARGLRHDSTFTLTAIAMLALGLALNATAFTIMEAMVFRGLPQAYRGDRVVYVGLRTPMDQQAPLSYADFQSWRSQTQTFDDMAFTTSVGGRGPTTFAAGNNRPIEVMAQRLDSRAFPLLGVQPILGRGFAPADEAPGAAPVVIISQRFWETRLEKRADILDSAVQINGSPAVIIGVMPKEFVLVYEQDLWLPTLSDPAAAGSVFGRLRDEVTLEQARAELETLIHRQATTDPAAARRLTVTVKTYSQAFVGSEPRLTYGMLWVGAWFVLLIVCANLANLTLARTIRHWRQFTMKMALGASQWRLVWQVSTESLLLTSVAGVCAWWIARWAVANWATTTSSRYLVLDYSVNSDVLLYLVVVALVAALLCALAPLAMVLRAGALGVLKTEAGGITQGVRGKRVGRILVASQMALSIVLLSGAGVLVRSLMNVVNADSGVPDPDRLLVGSLKLAFDPAATQATRVAELTRFGVELRAIPGVADVSFANIIPINWAPTAPFAIEGRPSGPDQEIAQFVTVASNYVRVVGAPLIAGRDITDADQATTLPVAIVNQSFVDRFLPDGQAVGRRLRRLARTPPDEGLTIVGVVGNVMQVPPATEQTRQHFTPLVYVPLRQQPATRAVSNAGQSFPGANVLVRIAAPPGTVAPAIHAAIRKADAAASLENLLTLRANMAFDRDRMDSAHAELANHAMAGQTLATIALLLATIGLYAVVAHSVSQRTKEIGVRMAIGAAAADIRKMVLREGMRPAIIGMTLGLVASLGVNRVLQSQLVGVTPDDVPTLMTALAVLGITALLACAIPARQAVSVDPSVALRLE